MTLSDWSTLRALHTEAEKLQVVFQIAPEKEAHVIAMKVSRESEFESQAKSREPPLVLLEMKERYVNDQVPAFADGGEKTREKSLDPYDKEDSKVGTEITQAAGSIPRLPTPSATNVEEAQTVTQGPTDEDSAIKAVNMQRDVESLRAICILVRSLGIQELRAFVTDIARPREATKRSFYVD